HHSIARVKMPASWKKIKEFPFNQQLRLSGTVWKHSNGYTLHIKGAPEQVMHHSKKSIALEKANQELKNFTSKGYRTIGFAHRHIKSIPDKLDHTSLKNIEIDGLVALSDQLRQQVHL